MRPFFSRSWRIVSRLFVDRFPFFWISSNFVIFVNNKPRTIFSLGQFFVENSSLRGDSWKLSGDDDSWKLSGDDDSWKKLSLDLLHEILTKIYDKNPKKIFSEVFSEDFYKIDLLQEVGFNYEEDTKKTVEDNVLNFKTFRL